MNLKWLNWWKSHLFQEQYTREDPPTTYSESMNIVTVPKYAPPPIPPAVGIRAQPNMVSTPYTNGMNGEWCLFYQISGVFTPPFLQMRLMINQPQIYANPPRYILHCCVTLYRLACINQWKSLKRRISGGLTHVMAPLPLKWNQKSIFPRHLW